MIISEITALFCLRIDLGAIETEAQLYTLRKKIDAL